MRKRTVSRDLANFTIPRLAEWATQEDAQRHLGSVIVSVSDGTYTEPSKMPLAGCLQDEWLPAMRSTVRPLTHQNYGPS